MFRTKGRLVVVEARFRKELPPNTLPQFTPDRVLKQSLDNLGQVKRQVSVVSRKQWGGGPKAPGGWVMTPERPGPIQVYVRPKDDRLGAVHLQTAKWQDVAAGKCSRPGKCSSVRLLLKQHASRTGLLGP